MKHILKKIGAWMYALPVLFIPGVALAQLDTAQDELGQVGAAIGTDASVPLPELIGNLIAVLLSVLGIIFVVLVVYAGYLYLTSAGEDEKVKKSKKLLGQAIIGLVIIIAAYAITDYVIAALIEASKP